MDIATLWIKRKGGEDSAPELIVAWDEYSIEENWEGWVAACKKELDAIGDDVAAKRFLNLKVNGGTIDDFFTEWKTVHVTDVSELDDPSAI